MRILFLADNFPPEVNAPATRTYEHCREWLRLGGEITVVTCNPNFPHGTLFEGYRNTPYSCEMMEGIRVIRVWSYMAENKGFLKRSLDYFTFAVTSTLAGLFQSADVIVATSPQFFTTWAGSALSKLKRVPWVFELRDLWPESIVTVGAMRPSPLMDLLEKVELALYRDSSLVVAVSDAFRRNLVSRGIVPEKIEVVTNGANLEMYREREKDPELLERHRLEGKFVVGYIGTHGMAHGLEFIVESLARIDDPEFHFLFIGDGSRKEQVVARARQLSLENVTFLEPVAKEAVPGYLSLIDASLVPLLKADTFKQVIPSKIFESAAMRRPILLGVEGEAQGIVESYRAGLCFEPENGADFVAKLIQLKKDRLLYRQLQQGCARLASAYDRKALAHRMYRLLQNVSGKR